MYKLIVFGTLSAYKQQPACHIFQVWRENVGNQFLKKGLHPEYIYIKLKLKTFGSVDKIATAVVVEAVSSTIALVNDS